MMAIGLFTVFNKYEELKCDACHAIFTGRRASDEGLNLCSDCIDTGRLRLINDPDLKDILLEEFMDGGNHNE